ncbi:putative quinol monooxygenase [Desulfocurvus sp. DL9XJH121]
MSQVTVVARNIARPGELPVILAALAPLVAATRAEEGCLEYVPHVRPEAPDEMCFVEKWASREALEKHLASEHIATFRSITGPLLLSSDVTVWEACGA